LYEKKLRYFEITLLKIYLSNFSRKTAMFHAARDLNFQTEDISSNDVLWNCVKMDINDSIVLLWSSLSLFRWDLFHFWDEYL